MRGQDAKPDPHWVAAGRGAVHTAEWLILAAPSGRLREPPALPGLPAMAARAHAIADAPAPRPRSQCYLSSQRAIVLQKHTRS